MESVYIFVFVLGPQSYTDGYLLPYTTYTYYVEAKNVHGAIRSAKVVFRTRSGAPSGNIDLGLSSPVGQYFVSLNWTISTDDSGPIDIFKLMYTSTGSPDVTIAYQGLDTKVTVHNLTPFTRYNFSVQACNSEGCLQSPLLTLVTAQAPPVGQTPPIIKNSSSTDLYLQWSPPLQPNGMFLYLCLLVVSSCLGDWKSPIYKSRSIL